MFKDLEDCQLTAVDLSKAAAQVLGLHALGHDNVVLREVGAASGDEPWSSSDAS